MTIDRVTIADQVAWSVSPWKCIGDLSCDPLRCRMRGDTERQDPSPMMAEDDQNIEEAKADRRHHEQIHRGDAGGMVAQKGLPALARRSPTSAHGISHYRLHDPDAELEQLAMNAATPGTNSSNSLGPSCLSVFAIGHTGSDS